MAKYDAFGITLGMGTRQIETATVVGTIVNPGNATFTVTKAGMTGSPVAVSVAVLSGDTADVVATKAAAALNLNANVAAKCVAEANGSLVILTALEALANDGTFNLAFTNGTCTGLTPNATSANTLAGEVLATIAGVRNIGGPSLAMDTEDATTHDSTGAWEEVIATILRSGEVSLDIVYDPTDDTHDNAGSLGLVYRMNNKKLSFFKVTFPDAGGTVWSFPAYVTAFEPGADHAGYLSGSVSLKITGAPTLA
jgi:predicted secreted protein